MDTMASLDFETRFLEFHHVVRNAARCRLCKDTVESHHRHDWVECSCRAIFVDGGTSYVRRGANSWDNFESLAVYRPYTLDEINAAIKRYENNESLIYSGILKEAYEFRKILYEG